MKNLILVVIAFALNINLSSAKETKYSLDVKNLKYTSDKTLEFDICFGNVSQDELRYSLGQYFLEFNPGIANGGNLTYTLISSDLPDEFKPRNASVKDNLLRLACNQVSRGKESLPLLSYKSPSTLIARMRLETSAKKFSDEPLNLKWTVNSKLLKTKIFLFEGKRNLEITDLISFETDGLNGITGNENITSLPTQYALSQNYPNPFNPSTIINYELPVSGKVTLKIYDMLGKEVATLVNDYMDAGRYLVKFNGLSTGGGLASGMYFYKITAGSFTAVKKMILIK